MSFRVGQKALDFTATAVSAEDLLTVQLSNYLNKKYVILFVLPYFCLSNENYCFLTIDFTFS